jgi:hypothetical protein
MCIIRRWIQAAWVAALATFAACLVGLVGCAATSSVALSGTNDASLGYEVEADPSTGKTMAPALAREVVKARLSAAQIMADVDATTTGVRVTVDETEAPVVDALVLWRGGLRAYRTDRDPP